jgi:tripartite-type tricarboxylate transporter receptor subunit TctC
MNKSLRTTAVACVAAVFTCASGVTAAQTWPSKPITIIVPFPAGGTTDLITRPIAQKLSGRSSNR